MTNDRKGKGVSMRDVICCRSPLENTKNAILSGRLKIGFLGGSITEARVGYNWPEYVTKWCMNQYKDIRIQIENAAIGATGSELGVFRAERDILQRNCNLVFVEYAVNDYFIEPEVRKNAQEGLIRKLLKSGVTDVVLIYTFREEMLEDMVNQKVPSIIQELEELAEHYGISSVWVGLQGVKLMQKGELRFDHFLPDRLHPREYGSKIYGDVINQFLKNELEKIDLIADHKEKKIPMPLAGGKWEKAMLIDLGKFQFKAPWILYRSHSIPWADQILSTCALGAKIEFKFYGTDIYLFTNFGKLSADYEYCVDGGVWYSSGLTQEEWCDDFGWIRGNLLGGSLSQREHTIEIRNLSGGMLDIIFIGIIP